MNDPVASDNGNGRRRDPEQQTQPLKADLSLQGTITIPQGEQHRTTNQHRNGDGGSSQPFLHRFIVIGEILVGIGLLVLGAMQYGVYLRQAKIMGNQARISENQLNLSKAVERAVLIVDGIDLPLGRPEPDTTSQGLDFVITIKNGGRSIASIDDIKVIPTFHRQRPGILPDSPDYYAQSVPVVVTPIVQNGTIYVYVGMEAIRPAPGFAGNVPDQTALAQGVRSGDMPLDIYGFIKYRTGVGWDWDGVTGYCYRYVPVNQRGVRQFVACDNQTYSYAY